MPESSDREIIVTVSDLHLSEGECFLDGSCNPLEDFRRDEEFSKFIDHILATYRDVTHLRLQLLGDTFDPLVVPVFGKFDALPYEGTCEEQMRRIIQGHPRFFDALRRFLAAANTEIFFYIGNHDFFLEWNGVQRILEDRIAGGMTHRIRFTYRELYRGVWYAHGNIEPHNAIDESDRYLLPDRHAKIHEPLLNYPYGSYAHTMLVPRLRKHRMYVGRLRHHGYLLKEAAMHDWRLGWHALWVSLGNGIRNRFFAFWDIRRKSGFLRTLQIIWWLLRGSKQESHATDFLRDNPNVHTVVFGHDHHARSVDLPRGRFVNTGTWALTYDIVKEDQSLLRALVQGRHPLSRVPSTKFVSVEELPVVICEHRGPDAVIALYRFDVARCQFCAWE